MKNEMAVHVARAVKKECVHYFSWELLYEESTWNMSG
jgi:hypothetical protein